MFPTAVQDRDTDTHKMDASLVLLTRSIRKAKGRFECRNLASSCPLTLPLYQGLPVEQAEESGELIPGGTALLFTKVQAQPVPIV